MLTKIIRRALAWFLFIATLVTILGMADGGGIWSGRANSQLLDQAWGQAGSVAYVAASRTMQSRNGPSQSLDAFQKRYLRRYFPELIDKVQIIYQAQMMERWVFGNMAISFSKVSSIAQTYCNKIYLKDPYQPENRRQVLILAHEMVHSRQCEQLGGLAEFGYRYFMAYRQANQVYAKNALEVEAYALQEKMWRVLSDT
ncbi:MAG: hypothetical protein WCO45_16555 [Pseudanabaena sp. ELA607]